VDLSKALEVAGTNERPRFDRARGVLIGSRCSACGATSWPARAVCHSCGAPAPEATELGPRGSLLTYTTVWVSRPGLPNPYLLGQVDLGNSVKVFGHLRSMPADARVPLHVHLVVESDEQAFPPFWFEPETE